MRIALIGDLQFREGEQPDIRRAMEEIAAQRPELAVAMGDFGCQGRLGKETGLRECADFLKMLPCECVPLLGNHDVEYRLDDAMERDPVRWYRDAFGREQLWSAMERDGMLLLFLSVEKQPREGFATQNALYASEAQFEFARAQLAAHRDWPTAVFCHCPLPGTGLRSVPPLHVAATDSYFDHCFQPMRWKALMRDNPQVFLWASAHFHMGHDDDASISLADGLCHVSCGVVTSAARDGSAHTRILDLTPRRLTVSTLNHAAPEALRFDFACDVPTLDGRSGRCYVRRGEEIQLGQDDCKRLWRDGDRRIYVVTKGGFLWEYDRALGDLTGAIVRGAQVEEIALADGRLYVRLENGCFSVDTEDPWRFDRLSGTVPPRRRAEAGLPNCSGLTRFDCARIARADGTRLIL